MTFASSATRISDVPAVMIATIAPGGFRDRAVAKDQDAPGLPVFECNSLLSRKDLYILNLFRADPGDHAPSRSLGMPDGNFRQVFGILSLSKDHFRHPAPDIAAKIKAGNIADMFQPQPLDRFRSTLQAGSPRSCTAQGFPITRCVPA